MANRGDTEPPADDESPSVLIIIGAAVGGFFALVILYVALKAICSTCCPDSESKKDSKNRIRPKQEVATIKLQKPMPTYDGPTHNNIKVVRADDNPNSKVLKPKRHEQIRNGHQNLASIVQEKKRDNVEYETYRIRREIENEIIENRQREQQRPRRVSGEYDTASVRQHMNRLYIENESNGYVRSERVNACDLDDDRGRRKQRNKLREYEDGPVLNGTRYPTIRDGLDFPPRNVSPDNVHFPARERRRSVTKLKSGDEFPPREKAIDLSRFKPQDLPENWLPPSKRGGKQQDFLAGDRVHPSTKREYKRQCLQEEWLPSTKLGDKLRATSPPRKSTKVAALELDDRDLRPDFRRGEEKKFIRQNRGHDNPSFENEPYRMNHHERELNRADFNHTTTNTHYQRDDEDEIDDSRRRRPPPVFRTDLPPEEQPPPPIKKKQRKVIVA